MELRWNEVFGTVWNWNFTDTSVNYDRPLPRLQRRLGVVSSFTASCVIIYIGFRHVIIIGSRDRRVGVWCWRWRASGFAWCVRSQVVGIATRRGARDETGARPARARPAHARPAQAMRLTANTKRKPWVVSVVEALNNRVYYEGMK